ncbi:MAG: hypothetical protein O7E52_21315 [Candidatus Poribacteria bacterium]|nr:hypothetical protein [Candidatus Poribacteria bacterium]
MKPYRLIYQMDSSGVLPVSTDVDDYLKGIVGFLEGSHIDCLFWHDGAGGNTANYDSDVLELTGQRIGEVYPSLLRLIEAGNDPPKIVVPAAKKCGVDIFYSFRLNDCHDSFSHARLLATFKVDHPEWTIGAGHPEVHPSVHRNLNFAVPEVRELKFAVIEEIFREYDFDGLEIDFLRSPPYFIPGQEPENAHLLTQFLDRVRGHLNQRGKERGRPITLAVRVDGTLAACRLDGFDVPTWVQERLMDIVILGSGNLDHEVEAFKKLIDGTGIRVYPCVYGWPSGYNVNLGFAHSEEMFRALASNYWYQGADGIYTFNWNAHSYVHRPEEHSQFAHQIQLLREIDEPTAMQGKDKFYAADRLLQPKPMLPHNWLHAVLPETLEHGKQVDVSVMVAEDFTKSPAPRTISLSVTYSDLAEASQVDITLNKHPLSALQRTGAWVPHDGTDGNSEREQIVALRQEISPERLIQGRNHVGISVVVGEVTVKAVEIHVLY